MALDFVASGDKLTTPTFVVPTAVTYTAWVKDIDGSSSTGPRIFENSTPTTRWFYDALSTEIVYQRLFSSTAEWRAAMPMGFDPTEWHHFAVTHDASSAANDPTFYLDGVALSLSLDSNSTGNVSTATNVMTVGNRPSNGRQFGTLAYVSIYDTVLTAGGIQQIMTAGSYPTNQFAHWDLAIDGATFVDLSGNSRTATKAGTPSFVAGPTLSVGPQEIPILDTFNRADGALGDDWTNMTSTPTVISNAVGHSAAWKTRHDISLTEHGAVSVRIKTRPADTQLFAIYYRITSPGASEDGYVLEVYRDDAETDYWLWYEITDGTFNFISAPVAQEIADGDTVGVSFVGTTHTFYHRSPGDSWTVVGEETDATWVQAGTTALGSTSATTRLDNFAAGDLAPPAEDPIGFNMNVTADLSAQPLLEILLPGLFTPTATMTIGIESGDAYPGGPGAGIGGPSRGKRMAVLSRRLKFRR